MHGEYIGSVELAPCWLCVLVVCIGCVAYSCALPSKTVDSNVDICPPNTRRLYVVVKIYSQSSSTMYGIHENRLQVNSHRCLFICLIPYRVMCACGAWHCVGCVVSFLFDFHFLAKALHDTCRYICFDTSVDLFGGAHVTHKIYEHINTKKNNNTSETMKAKQRREREKKKSRQANEKEKSEKSHRLTHHSCTHTHNLKFNMDDFASNFLLNFCTISFRRDRKKKRRIKKEICRTQFISFGDLKSFYGFDWIEIGLINFKLNFQLFSLIWQTKGCDEFCVVKLLPHTQRHTTRHYTKSIANEVAESRQRNVQWLTAGKLYITPHNWLYAHNNIGQQQTVPSKRSFMNHCLHASYDCCRQTFHSNSSAFNSIDDRYIAF